MEAYIDADKALKALDKYSDEDVDEVFTWSVSSFKFKD